MGLSEILLSDAFLLSHRLDPEVTVDFSKGKTSDLLPFFFSHEKKSGMSLHLPQSTTGIGSSKPK